MRKVLDILSWGFAVLFAVPTLLIMVSWNSLPGDILYPVKRAFEQVMLLVAKPSYAAEANLNVQYTTRRMGEVKVLLAKEGSNDGLTYLSQQIQATKVVIERAPNKTVQKQIAKKYITTLQAVSQELKSQEKSKPQFTPQQNAPTSVPGSPLQPTSSGHFPVPTPTGHPVPTESNQQGYAEPTASLPPPADQDPSAQDQSGQDVTDVQDQIQETIKDLEQLSAAASADTQETNPQQQDPTATPFIEPTAVPPTSVPTQESGNNGNHFGNDNAANDSGSGGGQGNPEYFPPATTAPTND